MEIKIIAKEVAGKYSAQIYLDGDWFKEVSGLSNHLDLMDAIAHSLRHDPDFPVRQRNGKSVFNETE